MTKDGGMVAQSFAVDCRIARAEVRIASQDQAGEFEGPVRLRPAREPKEHSRSDRDSRKHDH